MSRLIFDRAAIDKSESLRIAFIASSLHIMSPAGMFLCAPYGEALFSLLQFLGYYFFAQSLTCHAESSFLYRDIALILSGLLIGLATTVRTNGLISGILFAVEVGLDGMQLIKSGFSLERLRKIAATGVGGMLVAAGSIMPQFLAYQQYCADHIAPDSLRPWCRMALPSIYNFVQTHYWYVNSLLCNRPELNLLGMVAS